MVGNKHFQNKTLIRKLGAGTKATAALLPLLGVTWALGLLTLGSAAVVLKYLFAVFNSFQGAGVFIFHCVLNEKVRLFHIKTYLAPFFFARVFALRDYASNS